MSIDCNLIYKNKDQDCNLGMPVFSTPGYVSYWQKPGIEHGLTYVSQLDYLEIYDTQTLHRLLDELFILKNYWENQSTEPSLAEKVIRRIDDLTTFLRNILEIWSDDIAYVLFG